MLENIYNTSNSDDVSQFSKGNVNLKTRYPKNVRQIGKIGESFKIYVEDYVNTYTRHIAEKEPSDRSIAVLIGEYRLLEGERDVFIYGAIETKKACVDGKVYFAEEIWTNVYEVIKQYFPDGEIVGWFFGGAGFGAEESNMLKQVHIDNFAGRDKVLLTYDFLEHEDNFYLYDNGEMILQPGYYVYYEKNTEMQNYMVDHKQAKQEDMLSDNKTVNQIRAKLEEKKRPEMSEKEQKSILRLAYTAGTLMVLVALVVGITVMNNNEKMKNLEQALTTITNSLSAEHKAEDDKTGNIFELEENEAVEASNNMNKTITPTPSIPLITEQGTEKVENEEVIENSEVIVTKNAEEQGQSGEDTDNDQNTEETTTPEISVTPPPDTEEIEETGTTAVDPTKLRIYIVKEGDTIAGICRSLYGDYSNVQLIKELNQLVDENRIAIGQELMVP